jgi:hypothetical protein
MGKWAVSVRETVVALALGLVFFLILTPLGLLMRMLGADLLRLRRDAQLTSYWVDRQPPGPTPESLTRQF